MLLFVLSGVGIHRSNFLKLGVKICTYNHHCSAPSSRALLVGLAPPTLLGLRSRHCHGINYTHHPVLAFETLRFVLVSVSSSVSWFWNSVHVRAVWCASLARSLLILLDRAPCCSSMRYKRCCGD